MSRMSEALRRSLWPLVYRFRIKSEVASCLVEDLDSGIDHNDHITAQATDDSYERIVTLLFVEWLIVSAADLGGEEGPECC